MSTYQWRKSSYSADASNCVNVAADSGVIAIRESDEPEAVLTTTPAALRSFIRGTKAGRLDHVK
ncbi:MULTISPECIES: DUF397 domain-containing protein [Streptomyces]|uniref:DUF397 domain-containing protein n=1 Tax=Streptomyces lonegramiae TaxID=3075524 RepID=A0ABU2XFF9_9ACTN|nr:DUF397 domain-containing protein [Streptomyces sp. DSM 41529]MDT0544127.1 DUF397 domain-containing protein [Streptomyces sp. DSM 41529]